MLKILLLILLDVIGAPLILFDDPNNMNGRQTRIISSACLRRRRRSQVYPRFRTGRASVRNKEAEATSARHCGQQETRIHGTCMPEVASFIF
jgi:hypothetical protein